MSDLEASVPPVEAAPREVISWGDAWSLCYNEMTRSEMSETYVRENGAEDWIINHHRKTARTFRMLCKVIGTISSDEIIKHRLREIKAEEDYAAALAAGLPDSEVGDSEVGGGE